MTSSMTYDVVAVYSSDLVADLASTPITFNDLANRAITNTEIERSGTGQCVSTHLPDADTLRHASSYYPCISHMTTSQILDTPIETVRILYLSVTVEK